MALNENNQLIQQFPPRVYYGEHIHRNPKIRRKNNGTNGQNKMYRRKNILYNRRRLAPIHTEINESLNDYVTVVLGKDASLDCKLENYANEKVNCVSIYRNIVV